MNRSEPNRPRKAILMNRLNEQYSRTHRVYLASGIQVIAAYTNLIESNRRSRFEGMLARSVYGNKGFDCYVPCQHGNEELRRSRFLYLRRSVSVDVADAWYEWASDIAEASLSEDERRDAITAMLAELFRQRDMAGLKGNALREAAMRTRFISWACSVKQS
jgi:hypothetical protein